MNLRIAITRDLSQSSPGGGLSRLAARARDLGAVARAAVILAVALPAQAAEWQVVASGLRNPRGLDFAPNGALYIAEAGSGGPGAEFPGPDGTPVRLGASGAITRVYHGVQERIVTGLPSFAAADGTGATGPTSVSFGKLGHAAVTIGFGLSQAQRDALGGPAALMGTLLQMNQNGQLKRVADLLAFEMTNNPDGAEFNSNPNGAAAAPGVTYVADAGSNTLLQVAANSKVSLLALFPERIVPTPPFLPQPPFPAQLSMEAVPTNVVIGPDGALYVSQLTGFPFPVGGARVYRVVPGSAPTIFAQGFTNIIDLAFDAAGNLYVLEIDRNGLIAPQVTGRLARVKAGSAVVETIASDGLVMPGGMAIGADGAIYIANFSTSPTAGEVIRLVP